MANIEDLAENYGVNDIDMEDKQPTIQDLASNYSLNPDMQKQLFAQYSEARKTAEAQRALLRDALEKNLINQQPEDKSEMYFKLAAALAAPSTTKGFGEPLMNVANAMAESRASERKQHNENIAKQLSSRQAIAELYGADEKSLGSMLARYNVAPRKSQAELYADAIAGASPEKQERMREYLTSTRNPQRPETPVAVVKDGQQVLVPQSSSYGLPPASSLEKPEKLQQVPATQVNAQNGNFATIREIDAAIEAVEKNPEAFGMKNYAPTAAIQRFDPEGNDPRNKVGSIASLKRHDLAGAAVPLAEEKNLAPSIPIATDDPKKIITNLQNLKTNILRIEEERNSGFGEDSGYKPRLRSYQSNSLNKKESNTTNPNDRLEQLRKLHGGN
jgi:hypothetical protein